MTTVVKAIRLFGDERLYRLNERGPVSATDGLPVSRFRETSSGVEIYVSNGDHPAALIPWNTVDLVIYQ